MVSAILKNTPSLVRLLQFIESLISFSHSVENIGECFINAELGSNYGKVKTYNGKLFIVNGIGFEYKSINTMSAIHYWIFCSDGKVESFRYAAGDTEVMAEMLTPRVLEALLCKLLSGSETTTEES